MAPHMLLTHAVSLAYWGVSCGDSVVPRRPSGPLPGAKPCWGVGRGACVASAASPGHPRPRHSDEPPAQAPGTCQDQMLWWSRLGRGAGRGRGEGARTRVRPPRPEAPWSHEGTSG